MKIMLPVSLPEGAELREVIDETTARAAITAIGERHGLRGPLLGCARGSDLVYVIDDSAVVKLSDPRWASEIETEVTFLEGLRGRLSVATAEVLGKGLFEGWPYVVMSKLEGEHLDEVWPDLSHDQRLDLAAQIGALFEELRSTPIKDIPAPSWSAFVAERETALLREQRDRGATEPWLEALAAFLDEVADPFAGEPTEATLHTELLDTHLFVRSRDGAVELSGLIDFADGMRGAPSYEIGGLVDFVFKAEPGLLRRCLEASHWPRPLDRDEGRRLLACAVRHRFASLPRMLRAANISPEVPPDFELVRQRLFGID